MASLCVVFTNSLFIHLDFSLFVFPILFFSSRPSHDHHAFFKYTLFPHIFFHRSLHDPNIISTFDFYCLILFNIIIIIVSFHLRDFSFFEFLLDHHTKVHTTPRHLFFLSRF